MNALQLSNYFLLALVAMWSTDIGPEQPAPTEEPPVTQPQAAPAAPPTQIKIANGASAERDKIPIDPWTAIDRQAFLRAFKRQAQLSLTACLTDWEQSPQVITVAATLTRIGQLKNTISLDPRHPLPACAVEALSAMNFAPLVKNLDRDSVTLQWRIDW